MALQQQAQRLADALSRAKEESTVDLDQPSTIDVKLLPPELTPQLLFNESEEQRQYSKTRE